MSDGPFRPRGEPVAPAPAPAPGPPSPPDPPAGRRRPSAPSTWILGAVVIAVLVYITINSLTTDTPGSRGIPAGQDLPPFAAPLADGSVVGDANVLIKRSKGVPKACDVRGPGIFNVCEATERRPLVLGFMATRSQRCVDEVDVLDRLRARFPSVGFAVVAIRGDRGDVRRLVRDHGWKVPVAYDRDGAVANAYGIAICPTITFARAGGKVSHTTLGAASEAELARRVAALG